MVYNQQPIGRGIERKGVNFMTKVPIRTRTKESSRKNINFDF
jgi:hypothetical protein